MRLSFKHLATQLAPQLASACAVLATLVACSAPAPGPGLTPDATPAGTTATAAPLPTRAVAPRQAIVAEGELVLATPPTQLSFDVSARVIAVNVVAGQAVRRGDVLAEVDDAQLRDALQQARDQLALAEAEVQQAQAPPRSSDVDGARAALTAAIARYEALKKGPSPLDIERALRNWNQARNQLYSAQIARDSECGWSAGQPTADKVTPDDPECKHAQLNVSAAEQNERIAFLRYQDTQRPPTKAELAQAYADVVSARANLAKLEAGASAQQRRVAELQLEQRRVAVERAEHNLSKAKLISPCDCTVQEVNIAVGAPTTPGTTAITLLRLQDLRFRTTNLTERDVVTIAIGAPASVRLRAFEQPFDGRVRAILPQSSGVKGNLALFVVIISLDAWRDTAEAPLLPGMTGEAQIGVNE